ncbi:MAG: S9 family peptidase, partial [Betaproteobacteria bacterium]|nr:S9 family peptidase [Betaproteobacteria bacterium]
MTPIRTIRSTRRLLLALAATAAISALPARAEFITPADNLVVEGIPPIPAELAKKVAPYGEIKPSSVVAWHPVDGSLLISTRLKNTAQLHRIKSLGEAPEPLTDFPDAVAGATFQPKKG